MLLYLLIAFQILGLFSAFTAVMTARTSQGAIAWVISLLTIPYLAVPLYWLFGRNKFNGYAAARKEAEKLVADKLKNIIKYIGHYIPPSSSLGNFEKTVQTLVSTPYLQANALTLLIDGEATFASILDGIAHAKRYILLEFYILKDDTIGKQIQDALIHKASQGVKIYFLYDEIGSYKLSQEYINTFREAGIEIYDFHTQKGIKNRFQINFRNHRKIVVVDGESAWIGGHNIGDEYLSKSKKFGHWRDTHIKISGPSVITVQKTFIEDWYWAVERHIEHLDWQPVAAQKENKKVLIVPSSPADTLETASFLLLEAIHTAQKRIWISSPYFVPDNAILKALQLAGLRGVDVRILLPQKPDNLLVYLAAFTYLENIGVNSVKFFRYTDGFLHQKVMLIDDTHATVGTANLDNRSLRLNFEITALITDKEFAHTIQNMFEKDFLLSKEISSAEITQRPFIFKLAARLARLTAPLL
ncbi:MAG TPA: cardiolipin synthase [Sulfurimonas autotrophica]|uniref:Cardiolipin synthase n=1 Tax=Sulfurimonas autotrophica TaxID=202747 RepID=A0A7C3G9T8_9BACT|nr:cardiolipin synthase [Sulfurimonas autotrophica]